jgi:hypothetical protein
LALTSTNNHTSILKQLGAGLNRISEANEVANAFVKRHAELKDIEVEPNNDRVKDLHPSLKHMLKMASTTNYNHSRDLRNDFKSFFNSKNHGATNIQLHQLMEDKGFSNVSFSKGLTISLCSGYFNQANPSMPGAFSPFSI